MDIFGDGFSSFMKQQANIVAGTVMLAKLQKSYYDSLINEGFDEEQSERILGMTTDHIMSMIAAIIPPLSEQLTRRFGGGE